MTTSSFLSPGLTARSRRKDLNVLGSRVAIFTYDAVLPDGTSQADAPVILAIHGFRGTHHGLLRIVDQLPGVRFVMPDLPGFGDSTPMSEAGHDINGYGEFLGALADALGLGSETILLGHSFGSIVCSHFSAAHPERFRRLVLVNPISAPALEGPKGLMSKLAILYYRAGAALPENLASALLGHRWIVRLMSEMMAKSKDPAMRDFIHAQHHAYFSRFSSRDVLLQAFQASVSHHAAEVAGRLRSPTLLIAGADDEVAVLTDVRRLHRRIPGSRLTVIQGVGHLIHYETPEPAAAAIRSFLKEGT